MSATLKVTFAVLEKRSEQRRVYGWASIAETSDGKTLVDKQSDVILAEDLENAAAEFVKHYRQGGVMHKGKAPHQLIASVVMTRELQKALGVPEGTMPVGWLVGFELSPNTFAKVKEGSLLMFSIEGEADRVPLED